MKRSDKVYTFVVEHTMDLSKAGFDIEKGLTTLDVVNELGIQRANASRDLNELVREGLVLKSSGRPVRYIANLSANKNELIEYPAKSSNCFTQDAFQTLIGANQSLQIPIEQAKAAILYPPNGLNCLITGATGSGKSLFAKTMFEFAKEKELIADDKKLIIFNCADYAHNSELLMSHLFGYIEGAFTGAVKTKEGLIYEADKGILFLDEVHRLPPEGQEMIFYFMDHGLYNRLGETLKNQKANVRIICATTEDPSSALLNTFVRRIPINIQLSSFDKRTTREKIDLAIGMFAIEAERIQRDVVVTSDVMKALIGSVNFGNVGQLKSNVQLICARAFLNNMEGDQLSVVLEQLPLEIKKGITELASNRELSTELSQLLAPVKVIPPDLVIKPFISDAYELPYDLYELIGEKTNALKLQGVAEDEINRTIMEDINAHLSSFYKNHAFSFDVEDKLIELVEPEIVELTKEIHQIASHKLDYSFQINFIYALSLHISAYLRRADQNLPNFIESNESIRELVAKYPIEYQVALTIKKLISNKYQQELPADEVDYLALLIISLKEKKHTGQIGVVVAAHGESTASSMVTVARQLFGNNNITAVDMPLDMDPKTAFEKVVEATNTLQFSNGLLFLVDMGSFLTFEEELENVLKVKVKTIDMVTTSLVLEAARKTDLIDTDLGMLYQSLRNFRGYSQTRDEDEPVIKVENKQIGPTQGQAIVAICASGKGAAERMKSLIMEQLSDIDSSNLSILPISVLNMHDTLNRIHQDFDLIAITGIVDPNIGVPYFSMEELLTGKAIQNLRNILMDQTVVKNQTEIDESQARKLCYEYINNYFTFINPSKMLEPFWQFTKQVLLTERSDQYPSYINIIVHLAGSVERTLRNDSLIVEKEDIRLEQETKLYQSVIQELKEIEETFLLKFEDGEVYYIIQNIKNTLTQY